MKNIVLTVGNPMMGDDGIGPLLYQKIQQQPLANWIAIDGGSAPENNIHQIRQQKPQRLVIVDATDMGLAVGEIRRIAPEQIADLMFITTHNLPLNFLIEQLEQDIAEICFIGVQPDIVAFGFPMSTAAKQAVERIYQSLAHSQQVPDFEAFVMVDEDHNI